MDVGITAAVSMKTQHRAYIYTLNDPVHIQQGFGIPNKLKRHCGCLQDAIEKCSALLFFPFLSCHENIDPNPFVASCVSDLCV